MFGESDRSIYRLRCPVLAILPLQLGSLALDALRQDGFMSKLIIGLGAFGGSTLASYIPALWGGGWLASVFFGVFGGIAGILLSYRLGKAWDLL
jgi:hypothetical protein